ncbi:uncharacterized protein TrAFT101_007644 [Trichoderma asperellum]|uniref:uncharacterized protein n=1 Tax=Trichoderma asperellum TaxID=101201 RepID=UPI00332AE01D|nr:hypothetical protein TrAFT101_007644 [Trichoderma asperellum]
MLDWIRLSLYLCSKLSRGHLPLALKTKQPAATESLMNATITCSSPAALSRALFDSGNRIVKTSGREIAKQFGSEDLDHVADLFGPKLSAQFQDRVMAARLETIGAQDLINALARAERLGYHVNDIVQKKPGPGGETVIPSMSAVPPMPPHRVGAPPPAMTPYQAQRPPQQPQPYGSQILKTNRMSHQAAQVSSQTPKRFTPGLPSWVVQCRLCNRPCSSEDALVYHMKKARCNTPKSHGNIDVDTCVHCGCHFESPGGLSYHSKSDVCGKHDEENKAQMIAILQQRAWSQPIGSHGVTPPGVTSGHAANAVHTPAWKQKAVGSSLTPSPSGNDPYAKLTPADRIKFEAEMKGVDDHYIALMKEASEKLPPGQREEELAKLKNRYNTKQSNTRKKYGIRLRERRANADVDRSWNTSAAKRARVDNGPAGPVQPVPINRQAEIVQPSFPSVKESPRMRVPLSKMGGLSASSATAELVDPTASSAPANGQSTAPATAALGLGRSPHGTLQGTASEPMQIDNNESSTGTDSDDVDIPARI